MKPADSAPATFHEFEHRAWQRVVKLYEDIFGALTAQCIEPLLDAVKVRGGDALLDIATGPGYIAAAAARRGAEVTGLDFSSAMIAEASAQHEACECTQRAHVSLRGGRLQRALGVVGCDLDAESIATDVDGNLEHRVVARSDGQIENLSWIGRVVALELGRDRRLIEVLKADLQPNAEPTDAPIAARGLFLAAFIGAGRGCRRIAGEGRGCNRYRRRIR